MSRPEVKGRGREGGRKEGRKGWRDVLDDAVAGTGKHKVAVS